MALPDAAVVADKFHVLALAHQDLREARGGRRLPGKMAWLLHRNVERLSPQEGERLSQTPLASPALTTAWRLKKSLRGRTGRFR